MLPQLLHYFASNSSHHNLTKFAISSELENTYLMCGSTKLCKTTELKIQGKQNWANALAALALGAAMQLPIAAMLTALKKFPGLEHRCQWIAEHAAVQWYNDSKGTNVNATFYALDSMETPTVWIVGGIDKGNDYSELFPLVNEKVKAIICLGVENEKIIKAFGDVVDIMVETHTMQDAVQVAYRLSKKGDTVLLSPACSSFDLFENYEDRGRKFKEAVRNL